MDLDRGIVVALLAGIVHAAVVLYVHFVALPTSLVTDSSLLQVLVTNGVSATLLLLVGAVPAYLLTRHGLVTPLLLTVLYTWASLRDVVVGYRMEPFTTLYYHPLVLGFAVGLVSVVAAVEFGLREQLSIFPPRPLV